MDGLSSAASVIAAIQLAGSIVKIYGGYIKEVKDAKDEIRELQETVIGLVEALQELKVFLQSPKCAKLSRPRALDRSITKCCLTLRALGVTIGLGKGMRIDQTISETTDRIDRNIDLKQLPVTRGAEFDSYTNQYKDYCLLGTREDLLR
ncbi:hypothetical protein N7501_003802 [Penicillium viridicatum]|nr:hypothetical protein N7501_003802 [Penicillium viridicatum]